MTTAITSVIEDLKKLPNGDKVEIIGQLWDSCRSSVSPLSDEDFAEMERLADEVEANPELGIPWVSARASLAHA